MSTPNAVAARPNGAGNPSGVIAAVPDSDGLLAIGEARARLWHQLFFDGATEADVAFCLAFCAHRDLDPLRGEVVFTRFTKRKKVGERWVDDGYTVTPVVTAIGHRVQAARTGDYLGQTPREWCGPDGVWKQVWLEDGPPAAARVGILRRGCPQPIYAVAVFKRFAKYTDPKWGPVKLAGLWETHPDVMIATRAETAAFKLAFPETRREDASAARVVYRDLPTGERIRTIAGAVADDEGGEVFEAIGAASSVAERELWGEESRELHRIVAELNPEEPDVHGIVHELVRARFGLDSTKDATPDQLATLGREITEHGATADGATGEIVDVAPAAPSYGGDDAPPPDVPEKLVRQWVDNIGRADTARKFVPIEKTLRECGLDAQREIASALAIKRGELGLGEPE